ncbi:MAG TPA: dihydrodipicolinate synthase family protein, partial [Blastocatellia bacterium]|nr:dihydrodipicolinate synthase family protein [Blastocatellia bacterium]
LLRTDRTGTKMRPEEFGKLRGVIAFPVTPFRSDFSLDIPGLRRNIQKLRRHPLAAIVAAGGTGETYSLSPSEHFEVVRHPVEANAHLRKKCLKEQRKHSQYP